MEEYIFRRGTRHWRNGLYRSVLFGLVHMLSGVNLIISITALTALGIIFTYEYFRGVTVTYKQMLKRVDAFHSERRLHQQRRAIRAQGERLALEEASRGVTREGNSSKGVEGQSAPGGTGGAGSGEATGASGAAGEGAPTVDGDEEAGSPQADEFDLVWDSERYRTVPSLFQDSAIEAGAVPKWVRQWRARMPYAEPIGHDAFGADLLWSVAGCTCGGYTKGGQGSGGHGDTPLVADNDDEEMGIMGADGSQVRDDTLRGHDALPCNWCKGRAQLQEEVALAKSTWDELKGRDVSLFGHDGGDAKAEKRLQVADAKDDYKFLTKAQRTYEDTSFPLTDADHPLVRCSKGGGQVMRDDEEGRAWSCFVGLVAAGENGNSGRVDEMGAESMQYPASLCVGLDVDLGLRSFWKALWSKQLFVDRRYEWERIWNGESVVYRHRATGYQTVYAPVPFVLVSGGARISSALHTMHNIVLFTLLFVVVVFDALN